MYILITIIIIGGLGGLFYYFYKKTNELVAELIASLSEEQKASNSNPFCENNEQFSFFKTFMV